MTQESFRWKRSILVKGLALGGTTCIAIFWWMENGASATSADLVVFSLGFFVGIAAGPTLAKMWSTLIVRISASVLKE